VLDKGVPFLESFLLYIVGVELLTSAIRSVKSIKGLSLDSKEFKLLQYADDTTCLVEDTSSASNLLEKLDLFRLCSGLELNRSTTEAFFQFLMILKKVLTNRLWSYLESKEPKD